MSKKNHQMYEAPAILCCEVDVLAGFGASNPSPWDEAETGEAGGDISTGSEWNL